jgi:hypothetical protein
MSTEQLQIQWPPGLTVYFCVIDTAGRFRDFADNTWKLLNSFAVNGVTSAGAGASAFRVAGDQTALLTTGNKIRVRGSTGNDGLYTIRAGSAFAGGNTTINVVEAVGSAVADGTVDLVATPNIAATEFTGPGGSAKSFYNASVDLATIYTAGLVAQYSVSAYQRLGTFAVPATDTALGFPASLDLQFGSRGTGKLDLEFNAAFTSTAGTEVRLTATLVRDGLRVPLETYAPTATLAVAVREWGSGADLFTIAATTVNAVGTFELNKNTPGYTADRVYKYTFTLIENSNTWTFVKIAPNHG